MCEAHLVNSSHLPHDFLQKGTISNVAQDIASVERIWAVPPPPFPPPVVAPAPFQLYRPWLYSDTDEERRAEAVARMGDVPAGRLHAAAAIPAMSGATGLQWAFGAIHNTMAPLAMLAIVTFETVQLSFGERAFTRFFGSAEEAHRIETELSHRGERPRGSSLGAIRRTGRPSSSPLQASGSLRSCSRRSCACSRCSSRGRAASTFVSLQVTGRHCHRHLHHHLHHHLHLTSSTIPPCRATSPSASTTRTSSPSSHTARRWAAPSSPSSSALAGIHHMCRKGKKNDVAGRIEREKLIKPEDDTSSSDDEPPPRIDPNRASLV